MVKTIKNHVKDLEIGIVQKYKNLAIAPILGSDSDLEHLVFADALNNGLEITEKGGGSVPTLIATNETGENILAIAGEYIVGGKQNRTLTKNIYFSKDFEGEIPVRCVQERRWSSEPIDVPDLIPPEPRRPFPERPFPDRPPYEPRDPWPERPFPERPFPDRPPYEPRDPWPPWRPWPREPFRWECSRSNPIFRHGGQTPMCASLSSKSQGETWAAVERMLCCESVVSTSKDLNAIYREKKQDFKKYMDKFPVVDNQIGNIAVISRKGKKTFVLDLFDRAEVFEKYHNNLISSYALEAGLRTKNTINLTKQEARKFLDSVNSCNFQSQVPVSIGKDYKISGKNLNGSALISKNQVVYMNLFSKGKKSGYDDEGPIFSSGFGRVTM